MLAFLVWRAADSFAKLDVTAGPRGIDFYLLNYQCIINFVTLNSSNLLHME